MSSKKTIQASGGFVGLEKSDAAIHPSKDS
jgi:hypothetical protein